MARRGVRLLRRGGGGRPALRVVLAARPADAHRHARHGVVPRRTTTTTTALVYAEGACLLDVLRKRMGRARFGARAARVRRRQPLRLVDRGRVPRRDGRRLAGPARRPLAPLPRRLSQRRRTSVSPAGVPTQISAPIDDQPGAAERVERGRADRAAVVERERREPVGAARGAAVHPDQPVGDSRTRRRARRRPAARRRGPSRRRAARRSAGRREQVVAEAGDDRRARCIAGAEARRRGAGQRIQAAEPVVGAEHPERSSPSAKPRPRRPPSTRHVARAPARCAGPGAACRSLATAHTARPRRARATGTERPPVRGAQRGSAR